MFVIDGDTFFDKGVDQLEIVFGAIAGRSNVPFESLDLDEDRLQFGILDIEIQFGTGGID